MIYKLYRKEMSVRTPQLISSSMGEQSHFIEEISKMVKLIKKKEMLYLAIIEKTGESNRPSSEELNKYLKEFESMKELGKAIECQLKGLKKEPFYASKTYLYSVFMRIRELLDAQARRFKGEGKSELESQFQEAKIKITQIYTSLLYEERYQLDQVLDFITKEQNKRISRLLPKARPSEVVNRPNKLLQLLKQPNSSALRKTISVELVKTKESNIQDIVNRKLVVRQLATKKRCEQRKKSKPKKFTNLFKLYDVLELKSFSVDRSMAFKEQLEKSMNERNRYIKELIKSYERLHFFYSVAKHCKKK